MLGNPCEGHILGDAGKRTTASHTHEKHTTSISSLRGIFSQMVDRRDSE